MHFAGNVLAHEIKSEGFRGQIVTFKEICELIAGNTSSTRWATRDIEKNRDLKLDPRVATIFLFEHFKAPTIGFIRVLEKVEVVK